MSDAHGAVSLARAGRLAAVFVAFLLLAADCPRNRPTPELVSCGPESGCNEAKHYVCVSGLCVCEAPLSQCYYPPGEGERFGEDYCANLENGTAPNTEGRTGCGQCNVPCPTDRDCVGGRCVSCTAGDTSRCASSCDVCVDGECQVGCTGCNTCFQGECLPDCPSCETCENDVCVPTVCGDCETCFADVCTPDPDCGDCGNGQPYCGGTCCRPEQDCINGFCCSPCAETEVTCPARDNDDAENRCGFRCCLTGLVCCMPDNSSTVCCME